MLASFDVINLLLWELSRAYTPLSLSCALNFLILSTMTSSLSKILDVFLLVLVSIIFIFILSAWKATLLSLLSHSFNELGITNFLKLPALWCNVAHLHILSSSLSLDFQVLWHVSWNIFLEISFGRHIWCDNIAPYTSFLILLYSSSLMSSKTSSNVRVLLIIESHLWHFFIILCSTYLNTEIKFTGL